MQRRTIGFVLLGIGAFVGVAALIGGGVPVWRDPADPAPAVGRHSAAAVRARSGS